MMKIAITGTLGLDSKHIVDSLDHLTAKLIKPTFMFVTPRSYLENWLDARMHTYQIFHEGLGTMMEQADALICFGSGKETRQAVELAEKRGIKIKRVR